MAFSATRPQGAPLSGGSPETKATWAREVLQEVACVELPYLGQVALRKTTTEEKGWRFSAVCGAVLCSTLSPGITAATRQGMSRDAS